MEQRKYLYKLMGFEPRTAVHKTSAQPMVYTESYRNFAFNLTYKASKH